MNFKNKNYNYNYKKCSEFESSLKSYFLAPNAENREIVEMAVFDALHKWFDWRQTANGTSGPFFDKAEMMNPESLKAKIKFLKESRNLSDKFSLEIPRHSPNYIGHMLSDFTIPSFIGNIIALMYNPNNISSESSNVGLYIEKKSIAIIKNMIGLKTGYGHFTSGGTVANFEMIFRAKHIAKQIIKNKKWKKMSLVVPSSAHYSWKKGCEILGGSEIDLVICPLNKFGQIDTAKLKIILKNELNIKRLPIGVVSVVGTTELGIIDPIEEIQNIINQTNDKNMTKIWHHVDAAYGGFLPTIIDRKKIKKDIRLMPYLSDLLSLSKVDSITIDPHKLGYAPYSSGTFICRSKQKYYSYKTKAPYINYDYKNDPGPFTLEGSRSAAGPCAVYLTQKTIGFNSQGLGSIIKKTIENKLKLENAINTSKSFRCSHFLPTNILVFAKVKSAKKLSEVNLLTEKSYRQLHKAMKNGYKHDTFYISKTVLGEGYNLYIDEQCRRWNLIKDTDTLMLLRCTLMNPFFNTKHSKENPFEKFVNWIESKG